MIDKVEAKITSRAELRDGFGDIYSQVSGDPRYARESKDFLRVIDLRPLDYGDIIFHSTCKHGKDGHHKIELVNTGDKSGEQMLDEMARVVKYPSRLQVTRVDLTADVRGVPVLWFQQRMRAKYKQFASELGEFIVEPVEYAQMGKRGVETLYYGKRPNCLRVYDKVAERFDHFRKHTRGMDEAPDFEESYGYGLSELLTRVERQIGGGRVPAQLSTMAKLLAAAPEFNPFDKVEFLQADGRLLTDLVGPDWRAYRRFTDWLAGVGLRALVEQVGMQQAYRTAGDRSKGNAKRMFKKYRAFMPSSSEMAQSVPAELRAFLRDDAGEDLRLKISPEYLYDVYRASTYRQVAA